MRDYDEATIDAARSGVRAHDDADVDLGELLETMFDRAPAAICVTRGKGHVLAAANAGFRALAHGVDPIGRPLRDALPDLAAQGVADVLDRVLANGRPFVGREVPLRYDARDGAAIGYFNCVYQPLAIVAGGGVLMHAVDVTDLVLARQTVEEKAAELEELTRDLEAANEELDRFAYVVSHDLRAPLRGIGNLARWIEEAIGTSASADTREHLVMLQARVRRLDALIDGILTYSRAGRATDPHEKVDVRALVDEILDLLDPPDDAVIVVTPLPVLEAERVPLSQVLQNLLSNALRYGRSARGTLRVHVSAHRDLEGWRFTIKDDGPGIDARFHERIWTIFQTVRHGESTGVGLSLVRKIVEARGGRAWLVSDAGAGASFHFTWPEPRIKRSAR